jgi:hypothetical protein
MTDELSSAGDTSNDLLSILQASSNNRSPNYRVIAQSADAIRDIENALAISMSRFITATEQTKLLTTLSIYSERGTSRDEVRLLYMNEAAFSMWKAMGKAATVIAYRHRPPIDSTFSLRCSVQRLTYGKTRLSTANSVTPITSDHSPCSSETKLSRTSGYSTICSSVPAPLRSSNLPAIPSTWERTSDSSACSILGDRTSKFIPTCTTSFRRAALHLMVPDG